MKTYMKVLIGAVVLGGTMAFLFYRDIQKEVIAVTNTTNKVYLFQVGVFKSEENATKFAQDYSSSGIYFDDEFYRVLIAATALNKEKLEKYYQKKGIKFYVKDVIMDENFVEKLSEYDMLLAETSKEEVMQSLNKSCVELFLENNT